MLRLILRVLKRLNRPRWAQAFLGVCARLTKDPAVYRELVAVSLALGDQRAVVHACEALVALDPQDIDGLWNLAVLTLQGDAPAEAAPLFARHAAVRTGILPQMRACRVSLMDPARVARGEPYVATLEDVLVDTGYWSVIDGDRLYSRETHDRTVANASFVSGRVSRDGQVVIASVAEPAVTVEEPCVLLGGDDNYSHWLARNLLKLSLLEGAPEQKLPLLVNADLRRYQLEYLAALGIEEARLVKVPRGQFVRCRRLVVPTLLRNHPHMPVGIGWIRAQLARFLAPSDEAVDLVYLSRRDSEVRRLLNEAGLAAALAEKGFRILVASEMHVSEQIRAFSRARVVVSPHGAGLTNLIFAPRGALVLEIASTKIAHMDDFRVIAKHMGQRITTLVSDDLGADSGDPDSMHRDYRVNVPEVLETLQRELRASRSALNARP